MHPTYMKRNFSHRIQACTVGQQSHDQGLYMETLFFVIFGGIFIVWIVIGGILFIGCGDGHGQH